MSARVFNPVIMSEMRRMLRGTSGSGVMTCPENGTQSSIPFTTIDRPFNQDPARVRRDLFGPVNHDEARRLVDTELAEQQARDSDRWGFDFARGLPRKSGPGTARYIWEKVTPKEKIPEPYALRRMEYLSRCTADDAPTPATTATEVEEASSAVQQTSATANNQQFRIT
ncbi:hypothetical protein L9F63_001053, partial [Diploptera punctata]